MKLLPLFVAVAIACAGCAGSPKDGVTDGGADAGPTCTPPTFATAASATATAVIITRAALAPSFQRLAALHSVTGVPTDVLTIESICAHAPCTDSDPKNDTAKAIKDALIARAGLRYVILGGGIDVVPARQVHDEYANPLVPSYSFVADFVTDYYDSDFSEWDSNGDGRYAEKGLDFPSYTPTVPVSRIPAHTAADVDAYVAKVVRHLTAYDGTKVTKALVMSNVATEYAGFKIDAAVYLEAPGRTNSLLPPTFSVEKLYAPITPPFDPDAGTYSSANEAAALLEGQNLVVHSGHADTGLLTVEYDGSQGFTGDQASALTNATLPIFLSCGCLAGDFGTAGHAGERFILSPHGAIAYLGNAPLGLGLAGGMQLIDELLRFVQDKDAPLLADAYLAAHQNLPKTDSISLYGLTAQVIDQNSYRWTQKGVVLLGDELIPVWTSARPAGPTVTASATRVCEGTTVNVTLSAPVTGTLRVAADGALYEVPLTAQTSATLTIGQTPASISVGVVTATTLPSFAELSL